MLIVCFHYLHLRCNTVIIRIHKWVIHNIGKRNIHIKKGSTTKVNYKLTDCHEMGTKTFGRTAVDSFLKTIENERDLWEAMTAFFQTSYKM